MELGDGVVELVLEDVVVAKAPALGQMRAMASEMSWSTSMVHRLWAQVMIMSIELGQVQRPGRVSTWKLLARPEASYIQSPLLHTDMPGIRAIYMIAEKISQVSYQLLCSDITNASLTAQTGR